MDHSLVSISNIEEIRDHLAIKGYVISDGQKLNLPSPQEYNKYVKRNIRKNKEYQKLFLKCHVRIPNLSPALYKFKLFKKVRLNLRKRMLVPTVILRTWIWEFPDVPMYILWMYLTPGTTNYQIRCRMSKDGKYAHVDISDEECLRDVWNCKHRIPHDTLDYGLDCHGIANYL